MIIFDLDGTLANCEHRRHFVDPEKNENFFRYNGNDFRGWKDGEPKLHIKWKPDWKAFYEACDGDTPIAAVKGIFMEVHESRSFKWMIWSGRCESVREKTLKWLDDEIFNNSESIGYIDRNLKMRPIGDYTPDDELKEKWLDEYISSMYPPLEAATEENEGKIIYRKDPIQFVFDDRPKVVRMWRRRGIFVFNCNQTDEEF